MIHRLFFAQNRMMGAPPGTYAVTITVKEFFIDPDNAFADTEVGVLQNMTVTIGATTVLTNASGQAVFYLTAGAHTYEVYDNDRYLTTVKGEVTVVASAESVTAKVYSCLYKPTQVANMITPPAWAAGTYDAGWHVNKSGTIYVALLETSEEPGVGTDWAVTGSYIPISTHGNLNDLRTTASRTMGEGTIFEGTFTTGLDKNYLQVSKIVVGTYNLALIAFNGTYDGNNLPLLDMVITSPNANNGFIGGSLALAYTARNIRIINATNTSNAGQSTIFGRIANDGCVVDNVHLIGCSVTSAGIGSALFAQTLKGNVSNIHISNSISNRSFVLLESIGAGTVNLNNITFENCTIDSPYSTIGLMGGEFIKGTAEKISAVNCTVKTTQASSVNSSVLFGIIRENAIVSKAKVIDSTLEATSANLHFGGIVGLNDGTIINSYCNNVTVTATTGSNVGLISGLNRGDSARIGKTENCYAYGDVFGSSNLGAICGGLSAGGSVVNSYYDLDVSNQSDTGKGLPRTTLQMKEGTASSFILPAGGTDPDSLAANAMYTSWDDVDTWDFGTTSEYPTLK